MSRPKGTKSKTQVYDNRKCQFYLNDYYNNKLLKLLEEKNKDEKVNKSRFLRDIIKKHLDKGQ
jgi:hypothetical protein